MKGYLKYFEEEGGRKAVDLDGKGFFTYTTNPRNGEMYVRDLYICPEHRGFKTCKEMKQKIEFIAKREQMISITGTVYISNGDSDHFLKKLMFFHKLGFKSIAIQDKAVILLKDMEG